MANKITDRISVNSPVVICFSAICLVALILDGITAGGSTDLLFSVYRSSLLSPFTYFRFVGHVFGHAGWEHMIGNIMLILVIGPLLEEKYGKSNIVIVILSTAIVTGMINFIFFPSVQLLGASGVVFAFILLSSFTGFRDGKIPMTFILVAVLYIGKEVVNGIFIQDNVANLTHVIGGMVGSAFGFTMKKIRK